MAFSSASISARIVAFITTFLFWIFGDLLQLWDLGKRQARALHAPIRRLRPIPNSYWATPLVLACEYPYTPANPTSPKLDELLKSGVTSLIDLTEPGELVAYTPLLATRAMLLGIDPALITYHRFPIPDRSVPGDVDGIMEVLAENQRMGRISAVHCRGGIGRTGLVIGCWLVHNRVVKNGEEALELIQREWMGVEKCVKYPCSPETGPQCDFVRRFIGRVSG